MILSVFFFFLILYAQLCRYCSNSHIPNFEYDGRSNFSSKIVALYTLQLQILMIISPIKLYNEFTFFIFLEICHTYLETTYQYQSWVCSTQLFITVLTIIINMTGWLCLV